MKKEPDSEKKATEDEIDYDMMGDISSVASATEYTGLMYLPPDDEYQEESYNEIYSAQKPIKKKK